MASTSALKMYVDSPHVIRTLSLLLHRAPPARAASRRRVAVGFLSGDCVRSPLNMCWSDADGFMLSNQETRIVAHHYVRFDDVGLTMSWSKELPQCH